MINLLQATSSLPFHLVQAQHRACRAPTFIVDLSFVDGFLKDILRKLAIGLFF
ncbi:hypothetical protein ACJX0J_038418, partial [Zea mays]